MANDESIPLRVAALELRMSSVIPNMAVLMADVVELKTEVADIRANYVTKDYLEQVVTRAISGLATKEDLKHGVTKVELHETLRPLLTKEEFHEALKHLATKAELQQLVQSTRNWVIGVGLTSFFSLAALQLALFQIYRHVL